MFRFIADHQGMLAQLALRQLGISAIAIVISLAIALPLAVWLGHIHRGSFLAINTGNVGRALPTLAVLAIGLAWLGLGLTHVLIALVILAVPPMLTYAYTAVDGVDRDVVDAARGMGMREIQILFRAELPLALPVIFAGIRAAALFVVATATIASVAGYTGTLGDIIANQASYRFSGVEGASLCVTLLALAVNGVFALLQRAVTPRGLRAKTARRPELAPSLVTAGAAGAAG